MARKTKEITIQGDPTTNRDAGKMFVLTEMAAFVAEDWALRCFLALAKSNTDIPASMMSSGMAGLVALGTAIGLQGLAGLDYREAKPLLDDMMACVQMAPDPSRPTMLLSGPQMMSQIEEVSTIITLREAVIELHTGFSVAAALSQMQGAMLAAAQNSSDTPTSGT
jgi:hypothetical protein